MKAQDEIEEKDVFVVWRNTDLTEGRGTLIPVAVCLTESTAVRLAWRVDVQGANGPVKKQRAFKFDGLWYAPAQIIYPTMEDDQNEQRRKRRAAIQEKMLKAGISLEELKMLEQDIRDADQA